MAHFEAAVRLHRREAAAERVTTCLVRNGFRRSGNEGFERLRLTAPLPDGPADHQADLEGAL